MRLPVITVLILILSAWAAGTGLRMIVQFLSGYPVYIIVWQDVIADWGVMLFAGISLTLSVLGSRHRHDERHHDED
jgi:hypothetical protein